MLWPDSMLECVLTPPSSLPSPPLPHAKTSVNTNNRPNAAEIDDSHIVILRNIRLNMPPGVGTPRKIRVGVCVHALLETLTLFQTRPMLTRYNKYAICNQLSFLLYPKLSYSINNDSNTVKPRFNKSLYNRVLDISNV